MRNIFIVFLVFILYSITISAQVKSFNDLKYINSQSQFIKTCVENRYIKISDETDFLEFASENIKYNNGNFSSASNFGFYCITTTNILHLIYTDEWFFKFYDLPFDRINGTCHYDNIYKEVKNKCQFYEIIEVNFHNVVCYSCSGSTYKGKIGFVETIEDNIVTGHIYHLIPSLRK